MRYRRIGRTGLVVSELCLGTNTFGGTGHWARLGALDATQATAIVKAARLLSARFESAGLLSALVVAAT